MASFAQLQLDEHRGGKCICFFVHSLHLSQVRSEWYVEHKPDVHQDKQLHREVDDNRTVTVDAIDGLVITTYKDVASGHFKSASLQSRARFT